MTMAILATRRRFQRLIGFTLVALALVYFLWDQGPFSNYRSSSFDWAKRPQAHPISQSDIIPLPSLAPRQLPRIQHDFSKQELTDAHNTTQRERRNAVQDAAKRCWEAYKEFAWGYDELSPQGQSGVDTFGGWGATLVDSLDTLWIMGMKQEFADAVQVAERIDWDVTTSAELSLFETNIRFLGGLLAAYDLSGEKTLLRKAKELGNMLYAAFDTPNHLPANAFNIREAKQGLLIASRRESSAAVGTLSLEFTRLSQLTGDPKYYSVTERIKREFEKKQDKTKLPGMWPILIDLENGFQTADSAFTLGASSDSAYEYLSKMYELLGGVDPVYETMHIKAMDTVKKNLLFRPMLRDNDTDILFSGLVLANGAGINELTAEVQHLGCFAGGMFALGGRLFNRPEDVEIGEKLARGCGWAYGVFPTGIMPETSEVVPCRGEDQLAPCAWNESEAGGGRKSGGKFPIPFSHVRDAQYLLRPEAIESIFILYRITGKKDLLDVAWQMFESIEKATRTTFANSAIASVNVGGETAKINSMEVSFGLIPFALVGGLYMLTGRLQSFWLAETLKYFYLIFSEPDLISLDEYVFNTEAHPFRLPKPVKGGFL